MLKPRYYQIAAVNDLFEYVGDEKNHGKHPLISIPTGAGKGFVQALIVNRMLEYPGVRVLLITHQKWLIEQNVGELLGFLDDRLLDVGVYSAGLKSRDTSNQILFAGIQSVHNKAWEIGWFDIILIDEVQRVPQKSYGTYRKFLDEMFKINPKIVIVGLSATIYRMGTGLLTDGEDSIFDDICHVTTIPELINPHHFKNTDHIQYLCNIISKNSINRADLSNVHIRGGEYVPGEMQNAFNKNDLISRAVAEIKELTVDRKKILSFTAGIDHCEAVTQNMIDQGLDARCIHSKKSDEENEKIVQAFKRGEFRYLNNVKVLTEGFNEKAIDCVCLLMSTRSPGLYYQMCGRGLRLHPNKENCLVLDFGGNILFHGPIDKIEIRKNKEGKREVFTAPQKECPKCHDVLALAVVICPSCGYVFPQKDKHDDTASEADILSKWKKPITLDVHEIRYARHSKAGKTDSLLVEYVCDQYNVLKYREWICCQHENFAKQKADRWMKKRYGKTIDTVDYALKVCEEFEKPIKIIVDENDKWPKITGYVFAPKKSAEEIKAEKEAAFKEAVGRLM